MVKASYRMSEAGRAQAAQIGARMFETAQWAQSSEAAKSLSQMAARQAKGADALARLVRERQDLAGEWQGRDKLLIAALSRPPEQRNAQERRSFASDCPPSNFAHCRD